MFTNKYLITCRYFCLMIIILESILYKNGANIFIILLILLLIINNQLRFFTFKNNLFYINISLIIELLILNLFFLYSKKFLIFYLIPYLCDSIILLKNKVNSLFFQGILLFNLLFFINFIEFENYISTLILCFIFIFLFFYIKEEYISKINAQKLYDKLRISEEKLKKANKDLEMYANSIEELAILKERNRISREIHDSIGHALSTTTIQLEAIEQLSTKKNINLTPMISNLKTFVKESYKDVRKAIKILKPNEYFKYIDILKINELINNFNKLTGIDVRLTVSKNKWELSSVEALTVYRLIQESLSNSARHGKASKIIIFITFNPNDLVISIKDNGIGSNEIIKGIGLNSIHERILELKGTVDYNSKKGEGFLLKVIIPKNFRGDFIE